MDDMRLDDLLTGPGVRARPDAAVRVSGIAYRSDRVSPKDAFFCIRGFAHDGHDFASDAVSRGASAVVASREMPELAGVVPVAVVDDTREALARASARFFGHPSASLEVVGVTGTNGKTTTTYIVDSIMRAAGKTTGLVGTVEVRIGDVRMPAGRTTPESRDLQELLARMRASGVTNVSMEVSSHAIDLKRVVGIRFAVAAFTNLSQDHLDYHKTLEEYWSVKKRLFTEHDVGARVVNVDSPAGAELAATLTDALTVGRSADAHVRAHDEEHAPHGTTFDLVVGSWRRRVQLPLPGAHNVENALVAAGCAVALGIDLEAIASGLEACPQVPGRLERIDEGQPFAVLVDYAHTPDSLAKAIDTVREFTRGRVIVVFGCGGDRDREKRPLMGAAAAERADFVVVTSDNPRSEDPVGIVLEIVDGIRAKRVDHIVEIDRRTAIRRALESAKPGDAVLIAGKGHEDYQIFSDRTIRFDDREVAREELRRLCFG
ncbi:MAG: UDP-N-acetylmuramoyl-L-alanyl-D-glutamate--2,6-diaminopimelate ligase [Coriobacteriia bacterium]|nr:UDP-N-acetylmuramoyl-L-alanyl-D-glutamate--2,6-diaminopimelate ligase [Coriobacteriia bacterium]